MEQGIITNETFSKDKDGISYKHPERNCADCIKYPCFDGQEEQERCNYAKYGCINYVDVEMKARGIKSEKESKKMTK